MGKSRVLSGLSSLVLGALVVLTAQSASAQDYSAGRFTSVDGSVTVRGANGAQIAATNSPVQPRDYVSSGVHSRADIVMAGGEALRIAGGVEMHVIGANQVQLADGTIEVSVVQGGSLQIDTPSVTVRASQKGSYRISIVSGGGTQITARSGSVDVVTPQQTYTVAAGKSLVASGSASNPNVNYTSAVAYDSFDQYNTARDQAYVAPQSDPYYNDGGAYASGYGYGYPSYTYGNAYPVVVAPVCGIGINIGWFGGFWSTCAAYGIAFGGYYPWYWGGGYPWYGYAYNWPYWNYPYYGGYYPPYYPCCYHWPGRGHYPAPVLHPPVYISHGVAVNTPFSPTLHPIVAPGVHAPIVAVHAPIVAVHAPTVAHAPVARAPVAAHHVAMTPVRAQVFKTVSTDPWSRFDTSRGTHVAQTAKAPAVNAPGDMHAPVDTHAPGDTHVTDKNAPDKSAPGPMHPDSTTDTSDPWSRFTSERGDISVRPEPIEASQLHEVFPGGSGSGYEHGSYPTSGGSHVPTTTTSHSAPVSAPVHSSGGGGGGGGGAHSGGGGRPPR